MSRKIKIKGLYFITLGEMSGHSVNKTCEIRRKTGVVLAHAKYYLFKRDKIKYFVNVFDKTKYPPKERREAGICAAYYFPISTVLHDSYNLTNRYISETDAIELLNKYIDAAKKEESTQEELNKNTDRSSQELKDIYNHNYNRIPCGQILTNKHFSYDPVIGREEELENIIIALAQHNKGVLLIGESGVGKTALADKLAYKIQKGSVPKFLKNIKIIEVSSEEIVANTKYLGEFEQKIISLLEYIKRNNAILFIDEIHTVYGAGSTEKKDTDIASILKRAISRDNIKVIGTTTKAEYEKYFSSDAFKRRFETVGINEPSISHLYNIVEYMMDSYSKEYNISIDNIDKRIIDILIELTNSKHRTYNDKLCNPDLIIGIIEKAFAASLVNESKELNITHLIYAIKTCNRLYDSAKKDAINNIISLKEDNQTKEKCRVLKLN